MNSVAAAMSMPGLLAATREDPAQDQLRMVIMGLVALAAVLVIVQLVFLRVTSPRRLARTRSASPEQTLQPEPAEPAELVRTEPVRAEPKRAEPIAKTEVAPYDAPWPPPRVPRRGSARSARPADPPGSVLDRLKQTPDFDDEVGTR